MITYEKYLNNGMFKNFFIKNQLGFKTDNSKTVYIFLDQDLSIMNGNNNFVDRKSLVYSSDKFSMLQEDIDLLFNEKRSSRFRTKESLMFSRENLHYSFYDYQYNFLNNLVKKEFTEKQSIHLLGDLYKYKTHWVNDYGKYAFFLDKNNVYNSLGMVYNSFSICLTDLFKGTKLGDIISKNNKNLSEKVLSYAKKRIKKRKDQYVDTYSDHSGDDFAIEPGINFEILSSSNFPIRKVKSGFDKDLVCCPGCVVFDPKYNKYLMSYIGSENDEIGYLQLNSSLIKKIKSKIDERKTEKESSESLFRDYDFIINYKYDHLNKKIKDNEVLMVETKYCNLNGETGFINPNHILFKKAIKSLYFSCCLEGSLVDLYDIGTKFQPISVLKIDKNGLNFRYLFDKKPYKKVVFKEKEGNTNSFMRDIEI